LRVDRGSFGVLVNFIITLQPPRVPVEEDSLFSLITAARAFANEDIFAVDGGFLELGQEGCC
jgi:hypothetical protein